MPTVNVSQMSYQISTLLRCLRREGDRVDWSPSEADWQPFAKVCEYHQVTSFLFCHLNDAANAVPVGLLGYLRNRYFEISARNYLLAKEAVDLTLFLQVCEIPVIAFKGPVVAVGAYG